jgi:hypothetical protein
MQPQPATESAANHIPDWALLDVISFGTNSSTNIYMPVNLNGKFHVPTNSPQPSARDLGINGLSKAIDNFTSTANVTLQDIFSNNSATLNRTQFMGASSSSSSGATIAQNIANMNWSANSTWGTRRTALGFPQNAYLLPSEVTEIRGVADTVGINYNSTGAHFKRNEGRISALLPGFTTFSNFFTIYAYAQALDKTGNIDSEALTKTLVEVEITTPATASAPAKYKVKKLYTQPIPLGQ